VEELTMSRIIHTVDDIWREGPPVRIRDLAYVTGYSDDKIRLDVRSGHLVPMSTETRERSAMLFTRDAARRWLAALGMRPASLPNLPNL
jgi:hypothetical protein